MKLPWLTKEADEIQTVVWARAPLPPAKRVTKWGRDERPPAVTAVQAVRVVARCGVPPQIRAPDPQLEWAGPQTMTVLRGEVQHQARVEACAGEAQVATKEVVRQPERLPQT